MAAVSVSGDSVEAVALALASAIETADFREGGHPDRSWLLRTYEECLRVAKGAPPND